jgi:group I intron endonuclease
MNIENLPQESGVYCLLNTVNGKRYIGFSNNIQRRIKEHIGRLSSVDPESFYPGHTIFLSDWNQFKAHFIVLVIELTVDKLREEYWIREYESFKTEYGYNISIGTRISDQAKEKLKGHEPTTGFTGHTHTQQSIDKMIESRTGLTRSEDTKQKMSDSAHKVWETRSKEDASKQIQGSKNPGAKLTESQVKGIKKLIKRGFSYSTIADMYGVTPNTINRIATGRIWKHVKGDD